jgi:hypothetical protein
MEYEEFRQIIFNLERPVILLEGTRNLSAEHFPLLVEIGKRLAAVFPYAIFRSGNATGTDEAFTKGVCKIDPWRMEIIVPTESMGRKRRNENAYIVSFNQVSAVEEEQALYETKRATPKNAYLLDSYTSGLKNEFSAKALYVLRDTIKVTGSENMRLKKADIGLFYVNPEDPMKGGTGHTLRICENHNVPVITQFDWMKWIIS